MLSKAPEVEVYVQEMSKLKYGYPLYDPDPARSYAICIGDVGYVTHFGRFLRLFNVFCPEGDPINNRGVPNGFVPLNVELRQPFPSHPIPAGVICLSRVRKVGGGLSLNGASIPAGATIGLSCTDQRWAALIIKHNAIREDSQSTRAFRRLLIKNYYAWHAFARDELQIDISVEDMVLVTGHDMTNEWATATVVDRTLNCEIEFKAGDNSSPFGVISASAWGSWTSSVNLPLRFGPIRPPDRNTARTNLSNNSTHSDAYEVTNAHAVEPSDPTTSNYDESNEPSPNQCIFLRGYRVFVRPLFPHKIKAAAEPKDDNSRESDEDSNGPLAVRIGIDDDDDTDDTGEGDWKAPQYDIYKAARDYIFKNSDADIAVLHDADIYHLNSGLGNENFFDGVEGDLMTEMLGRLPQTNYVKSEVVDGMKVGSLYFEDDRERRVSGNTILIGESARADNCEDLLFGELPVSNFSLSIADAPADPPAYSTCSSSSIMGGGHAGDPNATLTDHQIDSELTRATAVRERNMWHMHSSVIASSLGGYRMSPSPPIDMSDVRVLVGGFEESSPTSPPWESRTPFDRGQPSPLQNGQQDDDHATYGPYAYGGLAYPIPMPSTPSFPSPRAREASMSLVHYPAHAFVQHPHPHHHRSPSPSSSSTYRAHDMIYVAALRELLGAPVPSSSSGDGIVPVSLQRPYQCDMCVLSFNRQHDLRRHKETHTYPCNGPCNTTFTSKEALKRHQMSRNCGMLDDL